MNDELPPRGGKPQSSVAVLRGGPGDGTVMIVWDAKPIEYAVPVYIGPPTYYRRVVYRRAGWDPTDRRWVYVPQTGPWERPAEIPNSSNS